MAKKTKTEYLTESYPPASIRYEENDKFKKEYLKEIKKFGARGAHITMPNKTIGKKAKVKIK